MRSLGRKGGRRPKRAKPSNDENLRQALRERIGVERLVGMIDSALESESPTERSSAARLIVAELSEGGPKATVLPHWATRCESCGHLNESIHGREMPSVNFGSLIRVAVEIGLVSVADGEVLVEGKRVSPVVGSSVLSPEEAA
jgi:hypothetical protein